MAKNDAIDLGSGSRLSSGVVLAALVLGSIGILPTGSRKQDDSAQTASGAGATANADKPLDGIALNYCSPYLEFWGRPPLSEQDPKRNLGELIAADGDRVAPEFLIVTVPDPLDTRLGYRFDAAVDAVQMAVESQGWNLDRSWLPWSPSGQQLADRAALKAVVDPVSHARLHDEQPGLLIFRKPREDNETTRGQRLLFLMIVGESPTTGVAKVPLRTCLDVVFSYQQKKVHDLLTHAPQDSLLYTFYSLFKLSQVDLRIVGPMFSGSHQSMTLELSQWLENHVKEKWMRYRVLVRSGDAGAINKDKFEKDAGGAERWPAAHVQVYFDSTLQHRNLVMQAIFQFLRDLNGGRPLGKMALLTESDTEFGNPEGWNALLKGKVRTDTDITVMKFPFHISQVAAAYNERDRKNDRSTPTLVRPSSRLSIPFDETGRPRDLVPSLSPAMTTATSEFVMAKILETISVEDFRYIGIIATDTRDVLFLAAMIRQYCPDVQLFVPSGDLLLGHPRYVNNLSGTVVATTYPLFSMAQRWDPPYQGDHRRHLFSHQGDQGIYNAALSLLGQNDPHYIESLFDYGMPFDELKDYSSLWSNDANVSVQMPAEQPSLWLSVIGQRGLWPVAYRNPDGFAKELDETRFTFRTQHDPRAVESKAFAKQFLPIIPQFTWQWGIVFLGMSFTAWMAFWTQLRFTSTMDGPGIWSGWSGMPAPPNTKRPWLSGERAWHPVDHVQREAFVACGLLTLLGVYTYVGLLPCWIVFADSPWPAFLRPELWNLATVNDKWNIRFAWLAYFGSHATLFALIAALVLRASHWVPSSMKGSAWCGVVGAAVVLAGLVVVAVAIPHAFWPWAESVGRGYLLLPKALSMFQAVVLSLVLVAAAGAIAVGRQLKMSWLFAGTVLIALLALPPALSVTLGSRARWIYEAERFRSLLFFERAVNLGSGVSPFVPILIVAMLGGFWAWCQLRRVTFAECFWGPPLCSPNGRAWYQVVGAVASDITRSASSAADNTIRLLRNMDPPVRVLLTGDEGHMRVSPAGPTDRTMDVDSIQDTPDRVPPGGGNDEAHGERVPTDQETPASSRPGQEAPAAEERAGAGQVPEPDSWQLYQPRGARQQVMFGRLAEKAKLVERLIRAWLPRELMFSPPMLFAEAMAVVVLFRLWQRSIPGVDFRGAWMTLTMTILWFLMFSVVVSLGRFVALWWSIAGITREFLMLPMASAYDRIPPMYARSFGRYLDRITPSMLNFEIPARQWAVVAGGFSRVRPALRQRFLDQTAVARQRALTESDFEKAELAITKGNPGATKPVPEGPKAVEAVLAIYQDEVAQLQADGSTSLAKDTQSPGAQSNDDVAWSRTWFGLRNAARACADLIEPFWSDRSVAEGYADESADSKEPAADTPNEPVRSGNNLTASAGTSVAKETNQRQNVEHWIREAEDFMALQVVAYVSQTTVQLKTLAYYLAVTPVVLLIAISSYPFQPQRFLQVCVWTILFLVVAGVISVYVWMEKNEFISRVSRTTPNQVSLDRTFLSNILAFVIPLVGVVLTQFPFFSDSLNQFLEPITRVLK
jgi:hypothetical protein